MAYYTNKYDASVASVLPSGPAGVALAVGELVYMDSDGKWQKADAVAIGDTTRKDALGVVAADQLANATFSPVKVAEIRGWSGLTIGGKVFLSDTAGEVTQSEPTTNVRQLVGFAISATEIRFELGGASSGTIDVGGDENFDSITAIGAVNGASLAWTTTATGTSSNAAALAVGPNGATNPVIKVDASTASAATGVSITGAAAAAGVAIAAISSGTNEDMTIDAKGTGAVILGSSSTGGVKIGTNATDIVAIKGIYKNPSAVAVSVPSITDPDIAQVAVDVSGSFDMQPAVGDMVIVTPTEALPTNCRLQGAYVSATDTVTICFGSEGGNVTGAAKNFDMLIIDLT